MKFLSIVSTITILQGCSSIADIELLNDVGLSEVREVSYTINKTSSVLYGTNSNSNSKINNLYGHTKNAKYRINNQSDIPYTIRDIQETLIYIK